MTHFLPANNFCLRNFGLPDMLSEPMVNKSHNKKNRLVITFVMSISNALSKQRFSHEMTEVLILVADTQNLQSTHLLVREAYL